MNPVSRAQAEHYTRNVNIDQVFDASIVLRPRGHSRVLVNSLQSLFMLLEPNSKALPGLDFDELKLWLEQVIGDPELATAMAQQQTGDNYIAQCISAYDVLYQRLEQYAVALEVDMPARVTVELPTMTVYQQH